MKYSIYLLVLLVISMPCYCQIASSSGTSAGKNGKDAGNITVRDREAIQQTALDYIEGWYEGNPARMDRSLHPDLIKRCIRSNQLDPMTKSQLVRYTDHPKIPGTSFKITIFDVYENIADVKIDSTRYMDYLQMGKIDGRWVIVNVLWAPQKIESISTGATGKNP
jgi:hypothetical protein